MILPATREAKVVLFDLDDTLFDHRYSARCVLQDLQSRHPSLQAHSLEFLEHEDFRILDETHASVMAGLIDVDEWRLQRMRSLFARCGEEITGDYARRLADNRQIVYRANRRAVPGAIPLLRVLKSRVRIGIVTNNFTAEQRNKMEACGLAEFVDLLTTSEEAGCAKPDPEIFRIALNRLGCDPNEAAMVGNSWEIDVIGGLNAGVRAVWFNRQGITKPGAQDVIEITSFEPADTIADRIITGSIP